jgi:hypothetical protein
MFESLLVWIGLATATLGALALTLARRVLGFRRTSAGLLAGGLAAAIAGLALPAREENATRRESRLDDFLPRWQFRERHTIGIDAPPDKVFQAILDVRAKDIRLFELLTTLRRGGRRTAVGILNVPADRRILEVATSTSFVLLASEPPRELVVGTVIAGARSARREKTLIAGLFTNSCPPGTTLAAMNFLVTPNDRGGSRVSTETRVYANDSSLRRRFTIYWRLILPGSDIIRRMWLRAIKERAEAADTVR